MNCCCHADKNWEEIFNQDKVDLGMIAGVLDKYRDEEGSLIAVLQETQAIYGYLPMLALRHIADELGVKAAKVFGAATFYTQFRLKPVGKYLILLCEGTACHVNGAERLEIALAEELKIEKGETTPDGVFTFDTAACLGCCSLAPVMMINGQAYGPLTPDSARKIIRDIYARENAEQEEGQAI